MWRIGCDDHPRFQQIAFVNREGGECGQRRLEHVEQAERFYRGLAGQAVRVGMEAWGQGRWFERLLAELGQELWIGQASAIRAAAPRQQKTDARDAELLQQWLGEGRFEKLRVWVPPAEERDLGQLGLHRHRWVQKRTRVKNPLRAVALNEGVGRKPGLWSRKGQEQFRAVALPAWTARRRQDNLELLHEWVGRTDPLDQAVEAEAARRPEVARLRTHPGVGPITGLAFVLTRGDPTRFQCGKQVASYLGLIPAEDSSGGRQRLGHITRQGNALLRALLVEAAHVALQHEPELGRCYRRLARRKNRALGGAPAGRALVVDVASRTRLRTSARVRFACRVSPP